jgi:hypothetical protein
VDTPAAPGHVQEALSSDKSEPEHEIILANPSPTPSAPSMLHGAESGGTTLSTLSQPLPGTVSSGNAGNPPVLDYVQEPAKSLTHPPDPGAVFEEVLDRKSTVSAIPNVILHEVEESSNAYSPLKSVARYLCVILDNCEVRSPTHTFNP